MKKILLAASFCLVADVAYAECGWVLWEKIMSGLVSSEHYEVNWEVLGGAPDYQQCLERRTENFKRTLENLTKFRDQTKPTAEVFDASFQIKEEPPEVLHLIFFDKKSPDKSLFKTHKFLCLPDTIDPRK